MLIVRLSLIGAMTFALPMLSDTGLAAAQELSPAVSDENLEERVRATLVALRVLSVERDDVHVRVRDGSVTLRGCVETKAEKDEIDLRVRLIPGVEALDNALALGCR